MSDLIGCIIIFQRLDRAWYDLDGGYDDTNNPFASIPEEYTKKKEEQLVKHAVKRMSAHQRQINKVRRGGEYGGWGEERGDVSSVRWTRSGEREM